ncbi:hypothetical protein [Methylibium sp.]|uniref:hypothetical protein n=1 Tax=Methylibium sp. TaxID=2067992 RepID=UPI003D0A138C
MRHPRAVPDEPTGKPSTADPGRGGSEQPSGADASPGARDAEQLRQARELRHLELDRFYSENYSARSR